MKEKRKEKRIDLKLNPRNMAHRVAITKLENYDQSYFSSLTDYIVHAITAYEEPMSVTKSELRKVIREELSGLINGTAVEAPGQNDTVQPECHEEPVNLTPGYPEKTKKSGSEKSESLEMAVDDEAEEDQEEMFDFDSAITDFGRELGF